MQVNKRVYFTKQKNCLMLLRYWKETRTNNAEESYNVRRHDQTSEVKTYERMLTTKASTDEK